MFDDPPDPSERPIPPAQRAAERASEFRMHAELAAIFEGPRKSGSRILADLDGPSARDLQQRLARLERARSEASPAIPAEQAAAADEALAWPAERGLAPGDYHLHRRPGEVMMVRWLEGEGAQAFYDRMQAHLEAGMGDFVEEEKRSLAWKNDEPTAAYLSALEEQLKGSMADRYLRPLIQRAGLRALSTLAVDEMDILHLCGHWMGLDPARIVGESAAPPEDQPTESQRTWFFKLLSLRGPGPERLLFFVYLQKSSDEPEWE